MEEQPIQFDFEVPAQPPVEEEEEYEPLPTPWVCYVLFAIFIVLFALMSSASGGTINSFSNEVADIFGAKVNSRILSHGHFDQWWRFVLPIFLHGGLTHIAVNSYSLWVLGRQMEQVYGSRKFTVLFMVAGVAGNIASYRFSSAPSLGASGALFGLVGAGIVFPLRFGSSLPPAARRDIVKQLAQVAVVNLALGLMLRGYVDNAAHVGGLLGGALIALFLEPHLLRQADPTPVKRAAVGIAAVSVVLLTMVCAVKQYRWAVSPWWSIKLPAGASAAIHRTPFSGEWKLKSGAMVSITDAIHSPRLAGQAFSLLLNRTLQSQPLLVGGIRGKAVLLAQGKDLALVAVLLVPDDTAGPRGSSRMVIVEMVTTEEKFEAALADFNKIVSSFKVLHAPPPDLHPDLPPPVKPPAVPPPARKAATGHAV